ncbi:hypothetical protein PFICI_09496 [Pestalotiopsis fici W106-1]|uniref:IDI-2 n=1 Tax=Pestalotiopsis fici (strain W106-1 / CGMCC3.15140) TaxID=1229662 RepID=W3X0I0_PESFW|nr:uncharacterized protein PFICI_09496 [Pestalotiopsis fici W106-1]ETS79643.1 hypothetical protein PFICI_09496 [Pestalotiopsis fici W106-1]
MKFNREFILALFGATTIVSASANPESARVAECGSSENVMSIPEGANASEYRSCLNHPAGKAGPTAMDSLEKRDCWFGGDHGCKNGYCWKRWGDDLTNGYWCWTALNGGNGNWIQCSTDSQCTTIVACGLGDCKDCGCNC